MGIEWWMPLVTAEGKMSEEAEKSVESNETGDTLEDVKRRNAELLRAYINEKPVEFVKFVCESVLGIPGNGGNPFMARRENDRSETEQSIFSNSRKYHGSFAQLMLDKIRDDDGDKSDSDSEYISFFEITRNWFHGTFKWLKSDDLGDMLDILSIQYAVFERYSGELGSAIDTAAYLVYEGVPLYRMAADGNMTRLSFDDHLYIYVFKKGEYWDTGKVTSFPEWVNGLYMKRSDLDVHDAYFSGSGDLTDEARAMRREAMWQKLGLGNERKPKSEAPQRREHKTKLLDAARAVIDRYYGAQYNENDSLTITSQKVVIEWLQATYGMSEREAQSIDIVTRPDSARRR
ncbi:hypothetical protein PQQ52_17825 [Paraburkholderia sediminicola]|uniref:hypothetical protein n=1 Tax=Paraburkholderia sediminicola TaxID=458836 RepID=UPI0038BD5D51